MRHLFFALLTASLLLGCSPNYCVEFSPNLQYNEMTGRGVAPLYHIGAKKAQKSELYKRMVFPDDFKGADTALTLVFFNGHEDETGFIRYVLVGNYTSENFLLYCDKNGNLDFTDDGAPSVAQSDSTATIFFSDKNNSRNNYGVRFKKAFNDSAAASYFEKAFPMSNFVEEGVPQIPAQHWFFSHHLNMRSKRISLDQDSVTIAVQDANADGLITANGHDAMAISGTHLIDFRSYRNGITLEDTTVFRWNDKNYLVTEWDSLGQAIKFERTQLPYHGPLRAGQQIPEVSLLTLDNDSVAINKLFDNKRFTLFYLWGNWCKACHSNAGRLQNAAEKYQDKLQVVGINSGEPLVNLISFTEKYGHAWP